MDVLYLLQKMLNEVAPFMLDSDRTYRVPVHVKLLLTLWTLGNQETFRQIGDRFAVRRSVAHFYYIQVICALNI